jgi:hypothetical protein
MIKYGAKTVRTGQAGQACMKRQLVDVFTPGL